MKDYRFPWGGNSGQFGPIDSAGRRVDAAGKLVKQTARPDLKGKNYVDPKRKPEFKNA